MLLSAAIGAACPPRFRGGSLSSSRIFLYRHYGSRIVGAKPRKTKEFKESGDVTPPALFLLHPPLCPCNKKHADPSNTKNAPKLAPQTGSENRVARYVE